MVTILIFSRQEKNKEIAMHASGFLHKLLSSVMHKKRLTTLILLVIAAIISKKLSLSQLAREIDLPIQERSAIRRADRFLGNVGLYAERRAIYEAQTRRIIDCQVRPWIIVDWSEVPNSSNHILRAAKVGIGRALTLYEEVHPEKKLNNAKIHRRFLKHLKKMLPEGCKPIIVTDAGFHNKWFREVLILDWDYVGRVRSNKKYCPKQGREWFSYTNLFPKATRTPESIGKVKLGVRDTLETNLFLVKNKYKGRVNYNCYGQKRRSSVSRKHQKAGKEPWVLASSLSGKTQAKLVVRIYQRRMQIEESFRDLKSSRYGFSFEQSHSKSSKRIEILLLIASLASLIAWFVGYVAEKLNLHWQFQSNSITKRRVISLFYLGCRVIKRNIKIPISQLKNIFNGDLGYV